MSHAHRLRRTWFPSVVAGLVAALGCGEPIVPDPAQDPGPIENEGEGEDPGGGTGGGGGSGGGGTGAGQFGRIHYSDLTYLGAFTSPDRSAFAFAEGLIAHVPTRQSLYLVGQTSFGEIDIPTPVVSKLPGNLNEATLRGALFDPMPSVQTLLGPATDLGGLTWFEGRMWLGTYQFYNVVGRDNLGITSFDESFGDPRGAWRVGPSGVDTPIKNVFHANKTHNDVMVIPESWSSVYTPGLRLAGGRHRQAGAFGGGRGPALYAFEANENAAPGADLNGVPLMYSQEYGPNWPEYRKADRYNCVWVWRGNRQAVIVSSRKGLGPDFYGDGPPCSQAKGWHAHPYEPRMYFVDVNDLGEVARGNLEPWAVRAYEYVVPAEMWGHGPNDDPNCKHNWMRDFAFDAENGLLYATHPKAFKTSSSNRMVVHVWQVN